MRGWLTQAAKRPILYVELRATFYCRAGVETLHDLSRRSGYATEQVANHLLCRLQ